MPTRKSVTATPKKALEPAPASANTTPAAAANEPETKQHALAGYRPALGFTLGFPTFKDESGNALSTDFVPTVGYKFAMGKDFPIAENLVVQPEVAFLSMGFKVADQDYNYNMYYLSLQGAVQYKTPFKAYVGMGLFLDYGLFGTQSYPSGNKGKIFKNGGLTRLNTGLNFEAGYPVTFKPVTGDIFLSFRKSLNNAEDDDATVGQTTKLNMVTIGYRYTF